MNKQILIVEDESVFALELSRRVQGLGYGLAGVVPSAEQALALAERIPVDLALLDLRLAGEMDGVALAKQLSSRFGIPAIFITAYSDDETLNRAKLSEPLAFLVKPIEERELRSAMEMALYRAEAEKQRKAAELKATRLQEQMHQVQKMDAVGRLAAGIAHDLNNALCAVLGNLEYVKNLPLAQQEASECLDLALQGCNRCSSLIRQLLDFSRQKETKLELCALDDLLHETLRLLAKAISPSTATVASKSERFFIQADKTQTEQVITNLVLNARDAMPGGGHICFEYDRKYIENPQSFNSNATPGNFVTLVIRDDGQGIPSANRDMIFEPFYTTKGEGAGCGLGLSIAYGIMQAHGGWIELKPNKSPNTGTTFVLYFPEPTINERSRSKSGLKSSSAHQTIMIVDDEPQLVRLAELFLAEAGYVAHGFSMPAEALEWYSKHWREVGTILLDLKMPEIPGSLCFEQIRRTNPHARVVLVSGYASNDEVEDLLAQGAAAFFRKPLRYGEITSFLATLNGAETTTQQQAFHSYLLVI